MAGNKLSPRQKMINMMYLVLTALLALNVSAEILDAFEDLREGMAKSVENFEVNNNATMDLIRDHVNQEIKDNNHRNEHILPMIDNIESETEKMLVLMRGMESDLEKIGELDESGVIIHKDERELNYQYWLGTDDLANEGRGNGQAIELKTQLDAYIAWANDFFRKWDTTQTGDRFQRIAVNTSHEEEQSAQSGRHSWEYSMFGNKPIVADLASLERLKMDVQQVESELLKVIAEELKPNFTVDDLVAVTAPVADIVPAGSFYEAKIFVAMASKDIKPEFIGQGISTSADGTMATIKRAASAGVIPAGATEGIQKWTAMVKVPNAKGEIESLPVSGEFRVRKPEVMIRSATIHSLYKDCGNDVVVEVPALGDDYNPDFSGSTGGKIHKKPSSKKSITIVPSARKFVLDVKSKTNGQTIKVDKVKYDVILPPKPHIALTNMSGTEYTGVTAVKKNGRVKIKVIPDKEFKEKLPKDARYVIERINIKYSDSRLTPPRTVKSIDCTGKDPSKGITINLASTSIRNASAGENFYVEIVGLKRKNFKGKEVKINLRPAELWKSARLR